MPPGDN